jgi:outer membrane protein assembly complex protein YaeT
MWRVFILLAVVGLAAACQEGDDVKVASIAFTGNSAFPDKTLQRLMVTRATGFWPWSEPRYFNRQTFEADLKRLKGFYFDRGYPNAKIASMSVDFTPARDAVRLRVEIDEGGPLRITSARIEGMDALPDDVRGAVAKLLVETGTPRDRALMATSRERMIFALRDRGYAHARVQLEERPGATPDTVELIYTATPGPIATFGDIAMEGTSAVNPSVIRRSLTFRRGELFRESQIGESQRRLRGLGLFEFAHVKRREAASGENGDSSTVVPTTVTVTEGQAQKWQVGVGYGTEDGPRGSIEWEHLNLFGGAQQFEVTAKYSRRLRGASIDFVQPYFLTRRLSWTARVGAWRSEEPAYFSESRGGRLSARWRQELTQGPDREPIMQTFWLSYSNDALEYAINPGSLTDPTALDRLIPLGLDPVLGRGAGRLASINIDAERRAVDHPLDPRRGYTVTGHLVHADPRLRGTFRYDEVDVEGAAFVPIGPSIVWATRVRAATIIAANASEVPFSERYFLGGSANMRGWGRYEVSPRTPEGLLIGGRSLFDSSTELRVSLTRQFGAVLFVDAGQVYEDSLELVSSRTILMDAGPGIRWISPIGIVRADVGIQFRRIPGLLVLGEPEARRWRIHFSIGHTF